VHSLFATQLPGNGESSLDQRLGMLLRFQIRDYVSNCQTYGIGTLDLLPTEQDFAEQKACPDGTTGKECTNAHNISLHQTSLFQEDAVYSIGPWQVGFAPNLGALMNLQIFGHGGLWDTTQSTASICQDDMDRYVIGQLPGWDGGQWIDPEYAVRCGLFNHLSLPIGDRLSRSDPYTSTASSGAVYGTNSDELQCTTGTCKLSSLSTIAPTDAHDLLKYDCLREAIKGDDAAALQTFTTALKNWDGFGFPTYGSNSNDYYTHDLALVLMCANALGSTAHESPYWTNALQQQIESQLWSLQDTDSASSSASGGVWNRYCVRTKDADCEPNPYQTTLETGIPKTATMLNEDAALILGAYGPNVWHT
jgi:hypothetical protein